MKKMTRLSLVAALAVAGFTTANAKPLTEAIQDVEVSGSVVYRYQDASVDTVTNGVSNKRSATVNRFKVAVNVSSKVNDVLKVNTRILAASNNGDNGFNTISTGLADPSLNVTLSQVYFSYTGIKNTTVNLGKQGILTPWTVAIDTDGGEQSGTGILALSTWGPVTFAGAWFNQTNLGNESAVRGSLNGGSDLYAAGAVANIGPVVLDAWYAKQQEVAPSTNLGFGFDSYTLGAKTKFNLGSAKIGLGVRYSDLTLNNPNGTTANTDDNSTLDFRANLKISIIDFKAAYVMTGKDGGLTALDDSAETTYEGWDVTTNGKADADLYMIAAGIQVVDPLHISLNYTNVSWNRTPGALVADNADQTEFYAQFTYQMSKNLKTYLRLGTESIDRSNNVSIDRDFKSRLHVEYTF